jgi:hypothetical protein
VFSWLSFPSFSLSFLFDGWILFWLSGLYCFVPFMWLKRKGRLKPAKSAQFFDRPRARCEIPSVRGRIRGVEQPLRRRPLWVLCRIEFAVAMRNIDNGFGARVRPQT